MHLKRHNPFSEAALFCCFMLLMGVGLSACGGTTTTGSTPTTAPKSKVAVAYAGSLVSLMEKKVGPAFTQATGYPYQGEGKGSSALANEIKGKLSFPDIFISASPAVNTTLMGAANGNYVSWYVPFIRSSLVIGYSSTSKFAADFQAAASGSKTWYQVLEESGMRIGRTDPALDPKGVRTIILMELAETYYHQPGLTSKILGSSGNTSQIFPKKNWWHAWVRGSLMLDSSTSTKRPTQAFPSLLCRLRSTWAILH